MGKIINKLADVPAEEINETNTKTTWYVRADRLSYGWVFGTFQTSKQAAMNSSATGNIIETKCFFIELDNA